MKKYVYLLPIMLLCSMVVTAQVQFGFKGGLHYTDARAVSKDGNDLNVIGGGGIHLGTQMKVSFDKNVYFVPQLQYAYKNFSVEYHNADTASIKMKMHYLEIPLLLEYDLIKENRGFFFQFGPSLSVALAGNETITGKTGGTQDSPINYAFNAYGRMEANLVVNAGYQFNRFIQFSVGYAHGLGSIVDGDSGPEITPRMITASLHYWPTKRKN
jgi:Outer membrane protein beta-barrel domain